jgi:hypothetical protein
VSVQKAWAGVQQQCSRASCAATWVLRAQYQAKIEAIVDQAQRPGNNSEGAWFCTL